MNEKHFPLNPFPNREDLFYPDLQTNISKILPTILTLFDYKFPKEKTLIPKMERIESWKELNENKIRNILFVTLDALGYQQFMKYSTLLKDDFSNCGMILSSVFPTITSTCITSIKYGEMPIKHGIVGHKINIPEIDNIVDTLTLRSINSLVTLPLAGVNVRHWVWSELPHFNDSNFNLYGLIENHIANSGLSYLIHGKQDAIGYASHVDCFAAAQRILETNEDTNRLVDIYIGSIDHIQHRYSTNTPVLAQEMKNIENNLFWMLEQLNSKIASETALVVTADHGQEDIINENKVIFTIEENVELAELIRNRGRSGRVIHLYSKEGKQEELVEYLTEKVAEKGVIVTAKDYPKLMGKGADDPKIVERLGDVQIILGEKASLFFGHSGEYDSKFGLGLNATHGSLSKDELLVPLLISKVSNIIGKK